MLRSALLITGQHFNTPFWHSIESACVLGCNVWIDEYSIVDQIPLFVKAVGNADRGKPRSPTWMERPPSTLTSADPGFKEASMNRWKRICDCRMGRKTKAGS